MCIAQDFKVELEKKNNKEKVRLIAERFNV
jgi:hypothetical protein